LKIQPDEAELEYRVIEKGINRTAKVMRGGRRFSFSALVAVGNRNGLVGLGFGKAKEVPLAVEKARKKAEKNLIRVPIENDTIPHTVMGHLGASKVLLKPASKGTGIIAGAAVRAIVELAGIKNILSKSYGSNNPINLCKATMDALMQLVDRKKAEELRGVKVG